MRMLRRKLFPCVFGDVAGLGRKTIHKFLTLIPGHLRENVRCRLERDGERTIALLDLLRALLRRPVIRDGCRQNRDGALFESLYDRAVHLIGGSNIAMLLPPPGFPNRLATHYKKFTAPRPPRFPDGHN